MADNVLQDIAAWRSRAGAKGIPSICSAHPLVIEAAMRHADRLGLPVLIEATCNQVNQDGGYTGMTPADFRDFVLKIAADVGFAPSGLILGGDHLGPNPWKHLPPDEAMDKAQAMIEGFAAAGFTKLHLDTSMGCAGEPVALADDVTAARAARLAERAEAVVARQGGIPPVYVVGTEVPIPGGALEALDHMQVTAADAALETIAVHRRAFEQLGLADAFGRAIAAVVQPGVEFGNAELAVYRPEQARALSAALSGQRQFVFEAHSTDYQPKEALLALVADGFAILKVGPGLTFALREALFSLAAIEEELLPAKASSGLRHVLENVMLDRPEYWQSHYHGDGNARRLARGYSYSDRVRYYWPDSQIDDAFAHLVRNLADSPIPLPLISQYLPLQYVKVRSGELQPTPRELIINHIQDILAQYHTACEGQ